MSGLRRPSPAAARGASPDPGAGDNADLRAAVALARISGLGARHWTRLMDAFGSPQAVLKVSLPALRALGLPSAVETALAAPEWDAADEHLAWLHGDENRRLVVRAPGFGGYPERLAEAGDPPPLLTTEGVASEALHAPQVAVVGCRNPSAGGREFARDLARGLVRHGYVVTSGLAHGIDAAAHRGALEGGGRTVAVLATGLERIYPPANQELAREIAASGLLVSEQPPHTAPQAGLFPRRNRIVSGLSVGVVVVEASRRSGALITARMAAEQGREVFAVPGSVHEPRARGCHALIRQGAKLAEGLDDLLEELPPPGPASGEAGPGSADPAEALLLAHLDHHPATLDALAERSGLTADSLSSILLATELKGLVTALPGGRYVRRGPGTQGSEDPR